MAAPAWQRKGKHIVQKVKLLLGGRKDFLTASYTHSNTYDPMECGASQQSPLELLGNSVRESCGYATYACRN